MEHGDILHSSAESTTKTEGHTPYDIITGMNDQRLSVFLTMIVDVARQNADLDELEIFTIALFESENYLEYFSEDCEEVSDVKEG